MSDETSRALEEAVRAHYADEITGGLMTDYFIAIAGIPDSDQGHHTQYMYESSETPIHSVLGLAQMGYRYMDAVAQDDGSE